MKFTTIKSNVNMHGRVHYAAFDGMPICGAPINGVLKVPHKANCDICIRAMGCIDAFLRDLEGRVTKLGAQIQDHKAADPDASLKADCERLAADRAALETTNTQTASDYRLRCHVCNGSGTTVGMFYEGTKDCFFCGGSGYES